jgi:hypothetical protein
VHQPPVQALARGGRADALIIVGEVRTDRANKRLQRTEAPMNEHNVTEGEQSPGPIHHELSAEYLRGAC